MSLSRIIILLCLSFIPPSSPHPSPALQTLNLSLLASKKNLPPLSFSCTTTTTSRSQNPIAKECVDNTYQYTLRPTVTLVGSTKSRSWVITETSTKATLATIHIPNGEYLPVNTSTFTYTVTQYADLRAVCGRVHQVLSAPHAAGETESVQSVLYEFEHLLSFGGGAGDGDSDSDRWVALRVC